MISVIPVEGLPEVEAGADLGALIATAAELEDDDVVVVAQKVVSKAEGRVVALADVEPSQRALELAVDADPRHVEVILRETARVVRSRPPLLITETRHGFVCASAGVDASNAPAADTLVLLPVDSDASAERLRARLYEMNAAYVGARGDVAGTSAAAVAITRRSHRRSPKSTEQVALRRHHELPGAALAGDVEAAHDRRGDPRRLRADELGGRGDLVRNGDLRRPELVARRVLRAAQVEQRPDAGDADRDVGRPLPELSLIHI